MSSPARESDLEFRGITVRTDHRPISGVALHAVQPVVATGLDGVADENALLADSPCGDADVELAVIDSPLLDGVVDRIRT